MHSFAHGRVKSATHAPLNDAKRRKMSRMGYEVRGAIKLLRRHPPVGVQYGTAHRRQTASVNREVQGMQCSRCAKPGVDTDFHKRLRGSQSAS